MNTKLNCVLLIDDDEPTNFLNRLIIEESGFADKVKTIENGREALSYLNRVKEADPSSHLKPDLIFLDINMPAMNGWEFIDKYEKLEDHRKSKAVIVMLTTSLNPDDENKAKKSDVISGFCHKPLTPEAFEMIIAEHFPETARRTNA